MTEQTLIRLLSGILVSPILVAVSGGTDSMVLLHVALRFADQHHIDLVVVHVHHGLRTSADRDAKFVEQICAEWKVPVFVERVHLDDVPIRERHGMEADARRLRYEAIERIAHQVGASQVLLAHHADDQVETVLLRLLRGTSLTGLAGMREQVKRSGLHLVRPFLRLEKSALSAYAERWEIPHVEDESNLSTRHTRNLIRHEVLPHVRPIQPNLTSVIGQMTDILAEEDRYMQEQAGEVLDSAVSETPHGYRLSIDRFLEYPLPLQRRAIKILLYCLAAEAWEFHHVESILHLMKEQSPSAVVELPGGLSAQREYGTVDIGRSQRSFAGPFRVSWTLRERLELIVPPHESTMSWEFKCHRWTPSEGVRAADLYELRIPALEVLSVTSALPGDRIQLLGSGGSKKLQDVFVDRKVPKHLRSRWPVFRVDEEPVWVPGLSRSRLHLLASDDLTGWRITGTFRRIADNESLSFEQRREHQRRN